MWQGPGGRGSGEVQDRVHVWHSWDIGTPPWVEKKARNSKLGQWGREILEENSFGSSKSSLDAFTVARCFSLHGFGKLFSAFKDLQLQIQYFPSRFWEESADYMSKQAEKLSRHGQRLTAPWN